MEKLRIRLAGPHDHARVIAVVDQWWGGRSMADMLPRLFFEHFGDTSYVAEQPQDREAPALRAFLVGLRSQSRPGEAYIHFVGVDPGARKQGLARALYGRFFDAARAAQCTSVRCVTSPANKLSIAYHRAMGFELVTGDAELDGVTVHTNYDGRGASRVLFTRSLAR